MTPTSDHRYIEFISNLRGIRRRLGISQKDLSLRLGKPQSFISKIETGERRVDLIETLSICEVLGVTLDAVLPVEFRFILKFDK